MQYLIGTRGSALAIAQSEQIKALLSNAYPQHTFVLKVITTSGDRNQKTALDQMDAKGIFVKEIEEALLSHEIHLAVHSMKDMPSVLPQGLCLTKTILREDARDVWISREGCSFSQLPSHAKIGVGSLRRKAQLKQLRPDIEIVGIRGNVDTRLRRMREDNLDGIVLAAAGLHRLHKQEDITEYFSLKDMIPACGQGAIAVEACQDAQELPSMVNALADDVCDREVQVERAFLEAIHGGCHSPAGARCQIMEDRIRFLAVYGDEAGNRLERICWERSLCEEGTIAQAAAEALLKKVTHHG